MFKNNQKSAGKNRECRSDTPEPGEKRKELAGSEPEAIERCSSVRVSLFRVETQYRIPLQRDHSWIVYPCDLRQ
jgi:hypothetical protein